MAILNACMFFPPVWDDSQSIRDQTRRLVNIFFVHAIKDFTNWRHNVSLMACILPITFLVFDMMFNRIKIPGKHIKLAIVVPFIFFAICAATSAIVKQDYPTL